MWWYIVVVGMLISTSSPKSYSVEGSRQVLRFDFNHKTANLWFWDDYGQFEAKYSGECIPNTSEEYVMFDFISPSVMQTIIVNKTDTAHFRETKGYLLANNGSSTQVAEWNFYIEYLKSTGKYSEPMLHKIAKFEKIYWQDPQKREKEFGDELEMQLQFLTSYTKKHKLSDDFHSLWSNFFKYKILQKRLLLGLYQKHINDFPSEYVDAIYKEGLAQQNDTYFFMKPYKLAMLFLADIMDSLENHNLYRDTYRMYDLRLSKFDSKTRDYLLTNLVSSLVQATKENKMSEQTLDSLSTRYFNDCKYDAYKSDTKSILKTLSISDNDSALLKSYDWKDVNLAQITSSSQYNYIDFWASWCAPCRAEMPTSKRLHAEYEPKGIRFVYISTDQNPAAWEKASKQIGISDMDSYLIPNPEKSELIRQFKINAIPRYMIIGKDGKVINANAPRPSDPKLRVMFDELLKK
jgi:thiol-disulfide isomerase/thioredoxin